MPIKTMVHIAATAGIAALSTACFSPGDGAIADMNDSDDTGSADEADDGQTPTTTTPPNDDDDDDGDATDDTGGPADAGDDVDPDDGETDAGNPTDDDSDDGDSDGSEDTSGGDTDGSTGEPATVPMIVEMTPADGDIGVHADSPIVVQFSEAMDKAATQAAYQSADLPAAAVTFGWNEAGDALTITPNAPLDYADSDDPDGNDALTYSFTLTTAAESELGEALPDDATTTFATLRRLSQDFADDPLLSGRVRDLGGAALIAGSYHLGDTTTGDVGRGFISFDVSTLADGPITVQSANFHARFSTVNGNPFVDLGAVVYQHVAYDTFNDALFDTPGIGSASGLFATAQQQEVDRDVADIVETVLNDEATYGQRVQLRTLWVFSESDGDSVSDGVTYIATDSALELTYLAP